MEDHGWLAWRSVDDLDAPLPRELDHPANTSLWTAGTCGQCALNSEDLASFDNSHIGQQLEKLLLCMNQALFDPVRTMPKLRTSTHLFPGLEEGSMIATPTRPRYNQPLPVIFTLNQDTEAETCCRVLIDGPQKRPSQPSAMSPSHGHAASC
jgi:hypothetical protein